MNPTGTVTFLFTDIENSTAMWDRHPQHMRSALARHDALLRHAFADRDGYVFSTGGDGFGVAFSSAVDAVAAALAAQHALIAEPWGDDATIRVRMGLHTGEVDERNGDYYGAAVSRAARISATARAGQIVMSAATATLIVDDGWDTIDAGQVRLKGFHRPEHLYCLAASGLNIIEGPRNDGAALGNLSGPLTPLIGRADEARRIQDLVSTNSLITLVGVGGVGKTRLALTTARSELTHFADGVWLVELAEVSSDADVVAAAATALDLRLAPHLEPADALAQSLGSQHRLIVFDNCEHVIDDVARLIDIVQQRCPAVTVIATSRELLGLDGEAAVQVRPLGLEAAHGRSDAVQLFCERAAGALGVFEPNTDELGVVEEICRRLDGLPLAIELAAARVPAFGLDEVRQRLDRRFDLLTRRRGAVERHRDLRTTISWSYDLLSPDEQLLFDRLSVLPGSFDLDTAQSVCGIAPLTVHLADHLAGLTDRSLVHVTHTSVDTRYHLLESLREFGDERLRDRGEHEEMRRRHADHFVRWIALADAGIRGRDEHLWHGRFVAEWHHLRGALGWSVEVADADAACTLIWHVTRFASTRLRLEIADWAEQVSALATARDHPLRPIVVATAASIAHLRGDYRRAQDLIHLAISEEARLGEAVEPFVPEITGLLLLGRGFAVVEQSIADMRRRSDTVYWQLMADRRETLRVWMLLSTSDLPDDTVQSLLDISRAAVDAAEAFGNPTLTASILCNYAAALPASELDVEVRLLERAMAMAERVEADGPSSGIYPDLANAYTALGRPLDALTLLERGLRRRIRVGSWNEMFTLLSGAITAFVAVDRPDLGAQLYGFFGKQLASTPLLRVSMISPQSEGELRIALGDDEFEHLAGSGGSLTIFAITDLALDAIAELTSTSDPSA